MLNNNPTHSLPDTLVAALVRLVLMKLAPNVSQTACHISRSVQHGVCMFFLCFLPVVWVCYCVYHIVCFTITWYGPFGSFVHFPVPSPSQFPFPCGCTHAVDHRKTFSSFTFGTNMPTTHTLFPVYYYNALVSKDRTKHALPVLVSFLAKRRTVHLR